MHTTLQLMGRPLIGSLLEWTFILGWIGAWATIAFLLTRIGYTLTDLELGGWAGAGIGVWIALWLLAMLMRYYWHDGYVLQDRVAQGRLGHMAYHTVRWPILLAMVATANETVMIVALWLDALCAVLLGIVMLIVYMLSLYCLW